ncbi:tyrosine-type recombinase/integrase [Candidatus Cryosericum septentrionale]|jgi:integrase/recombinase XerD|uniref:Integrase n=1 Tax=Candidatus Cryosericum septentrionale TaxID=2290913 RepID=A0A398DXY7_9BACT|nr:tyrosine-type recombinase/integrase [Candidatus Cryosericum septentrionale]RIE16757.1 integrase [Candidatus Cryosericum septentrionale]
MKEITPRQPAGTLAANLDQLIESFLLAQDVGITSKIVYRRALKRFKEFLSLREAAGGVGYLTKTDIVQYKSHLLAEGLSPRTGNLYLTSVRQFFKYLESNRIYPDVSAGLKGFKRSYGFNRDPLTLQQARDLLNSIDTSDMIGLRDFAMINLMLRTGLRTMEVVGSDVGDIRQTSNATLLYVRSKGKDAKDDFVVLTREAYEPIVRYLAARRCTDPRAPLFVSHSNHNEGRRITTKTLRFEVKQKLLGIGVYSSRISAHSLRHTFATMALQNGATIEQVRDTLRHQNITTTQIYVHTTDRLEHAAEDTIKI